MCALSIVKNENAIEHQYKLEPLHVQLDQHPSPHSFPIQDEPVLSVKHPQRISLLNRNLYPKLMSIAQSTQKQLSSNKKRD